MTIKHKRRKGMADVPLVDAEEQRACACEENHQPSHEWRCCRIDCCQDLRRQVGQLHKEQRQEPVAQVGGGGEDDGADEEDEQRYKAHGCN